VFLLLNETFLSKEVVPWLQEGPSRSQAAVPLLGEQRVPFCVATRKVTLRAKGGPALGVARSGLAGLTLPVSVLGAELWSEERPCPTQAMDSRGAQCLLRRQQS
jgi:hypothetical protein